LSFPLRGLTLNVDALRAKEKTIFKQVLQAKKTIFKQFHNTEPEINSIDY